MNNRCSSSTSENISIHEIKVRHLTTRLDIQQVYYLRHQIEGASIHMVDAQFLELEKKEMR
jgi:hypothetical protein